MQLIKGINYTSFIKSRAAILLAGALILSFCGILYRQYELHSQKQNVQAVIGALQLLDHHFLKYETLLDSVVSNMTEEKQVAIISEDPYEHFVASEKLQREVLTPLLLTHPEISFLQLQVEDGVEISSGNEFKGGGTKLFDPVSDFITVNLNHSFTMIKPINLYSKRANLRLDLQPDSVLYDELDSKGCFECSLVILADDGKTVFPSGHATLMDMDSNRTYTRQSDYLRWSVTGIEPSIYQLFVNLKWVYLFLCISLVWISWRIWSRQPKAKLADLDENGKRFIETMQTKGECAVQNESKASLSTEEFLNYSALKLQYNEHFLYNTLETINCYAILHDTGEISEIVEAAAGLIRYSESRKQKATLKQELENIRQFQIVLEYRLQKKVNLVVEVPDRYEQVILPKLTLQPLVDNCILHAFKDGLDSEHRIRIYLEEAERHYAIYVEDNGCGFKADAAPMLREHLSTGQPEVGRGLVTVEQRLQLIFGPASGLEAVSIKPHGAEVRILIPKQISVNGERAPANCAARWGYFFENASKSEICCAAKRICGGRGQFGLPKCLHSAAKQSRISLQPTAPGVVFKSRFIGKVR
ncbi:sensor histidine kinase [Paenibacillus thalictri]|uniref:Uncharacterized protein n=1 Tax=Paenibacillus thalictri TaxID=2527873 RepID=A0A4Q9DSW7_9BACL|nr:histidine kinase [Paenibacillus thalictri]TBL78589.1 hypothetical protein EYB31_13895 [Paenibacillus thalictri]